MAIQVAAANAVAGGARRGPWLAEIGLSCTAAVEGCGEFLRNLAGDFGGAVGGVVVDYYYLEGDSLLRQNRAQAAADVGLFVARRDDDRHPQQTGEPGTPSLPQHAQPRRAGGQSRGSGRG